jgi:hypothetical protein
VNALVEADRVNLLQGDVVEITVPSPSGKDQKIARCAKCQVAVWSNYLVFFKGILGDAIRFIRVGTLDDPSRMPPDIHIFTSSKQPWVTLPPDAQVVEEYYVTQDVWPKESLDRMAAMLAAVQNPD